MQPIGDTINLPRDTRYARVMPSLAAGLGLFFGVSALFQGSLTDALPVMLASGALFDLAVGIRVVFRRAHRLVFTTHGVWLPKRQGDGEFIRWAEIQEVRIDRSFLVLRSAATTVRVHVHSFKDPDALIRVVRERVPNGLGGHLLVEGEA